MFDLTHGWTGRVVAVALAAGCAGLGAVAATAASASPQTQPSAIPPPPKPGQEQRVPQVLPHGKPQAHALNAAAAPVTVSCGETLTKSVTLTADLQCSGLVGLILGAPKVTLNLNGHSIFGPEVSGAIGIQIRGASDIVENGEIAFWETGIEIADPAATSLPTAATLLKVTSEYNLIFGIIDDGTGTKLTTSTARGNGNTGIASSGTSGVYHGNRSLNNGVAGFDLSYATGVTLSANVADGNKSSGIFMFSGHKISLSGNIADSNGGYGIDDDLGYSTVDAGDNAAAGNQIGNSTATTLPQCYGIVCG